MLRLMPLMTGKPVTATTRFLDGFLPSLKTDHPLPARAPAQS